MRKNHRPSIVSAVITAFLASMASTAYAGTASLVSIGVLDPGHPESAVKGLAADGSCAVGYSLGPSIDGERTIRLPVFWAADTGLVKLPNPEPNGAGTDVDGEARGIVLRPLHDSIGEGIGISGNIGLFYAPTNGSTPFLTTCWQFYKAKRSDPGNGTGWQTGGASNSQIPSPLGFYNTSRLLPGTDESWFMVGKRRNSNNGNFIGRANNLRIDPVGLTDFVNIGCIDNAATLASYSIANSVATNRRSVGFDNGNAPCNTTSYRAVYFPTVNANGQAIPGGSGVFSQGFGISSDGNQLCGVDATAFTGTHSNAAPNMTPTAGQAFVWKVGDAAMTLLSNLPDHVVGSAIAINNFGTTVGYSSDGTTEQAVIWDKSGIWDSSGEPKLLTDLLIGFGVDVSQWSHLSRVTSISDAGKAVAGWGVWAADGSMRGFVATSPIALGACCQRTGYGTGTCGIMTPTQCHDAGGTYLGDDTFCGGGNSNCGDFCGPPWADSDLDGDVDARDFGFFQSCYTGDNVVALSTGCKCMDKFKADGSGADSFIDQSDLAAFIKCTSGPSIPFNLASPPEGCLP